VLFLVSLVGTAVSAAVLIMLIPSLFRSVDQSTVWAAGVLGCLTLVFAQGTRYWHPSRTISDGA